MITLLFLVLLVAAVLLNGFFSGSETGLYCLNRLRLQLDARRGRRAAMRLEAMLKDETAALSATLIGTNVAGYLATTVTAAWLTMSFAISDANVEIYTTIIATPLLFVFGEMVPKNLFQVHADELMRRISRPLAWANGLLRITGALHAVSYLSAVATRIFQRGAADEAPAGPRRRVADMLRGALLDRAPDSELTDLVDRVIVLRETPLYRVMIPLTRVLMITADADRAALIRVARDTTHSRLPVYDRSTGEVIGVVKVDDLIKTSDWQRVRDKARPITRIPSDTTVSAAIARAQANRDPMLLVVNRRQRVIGIATLKDLLEEIVGELSAW